nr:TIGR04076 family protein [Chloroflexota bacterium]
DDIKKKFELAKHLGVVVACCTDGFRPVVFEIERVE